jgi:hypothetical protein
MKLSEITARIEREHAARMVRPLPRESPDHPILYEVRDPTIQHERDEVAGVPEPADEAGFVIIDATTAHAMNVVRAALAPRNQEKWDRTTLGLLVEFTWKVVK